MNAARTRPSRVDADATTAGTSRRAAPATHGEESRPAAGPDRW